MRVLSSLVDPRLGGPQVRSLAVAKELRSDNIETVFLLPDGDNEFERMASEAGFTVRRPGLSQIKPPRQVTGNLKYILSFPLAVQRIRRIISEEDIDIVHAYMPVNFEAAVATALSDARLMWQFNDTSKPEFLARFSAKMASSLADEITVAADAVSEYYFENINTDTTPLYSPVDIDKYDPAVVQADQKYLENEVNVQTEGPVIGTVGNLNPIKAQDDLLKAVKHVTNENGPVTTIIVGAHIDTRADYIDGLYELRRELGLDDHVHFLGRRSDIKELLSTLDLFVFPSVAEACPMAVLEAMAMERPVVATEVGGVPEQITHGKHGWLVPPGEPQQLAEAITTALSSPEERDRRGKQARQRAVDVFSLERCVERHKEIYQIAMNDD